MLACINRKVLSFIVPIHYHFPHWILHFHRYSNLERQLKAAEDLVCRCLVKNANLPLVNTCTYDKITFLTVIIITSSSGWVCEVCKIKVVGAEFTDYDWMKQLLNLNFISKLPTIKHVSLSYHLPFSPSLVLKPDLLDQTIITC
jgi:hypothetical protein